MNLVPAYGRDYKSIKEVEKDFNDDKDFMVADISQDRDVGRYVNRPQLIGKFDKVTIRYKKLTMVTVIKVK